MKKQNFIIVLIIFTLQITCSSDSISSVDLVAEV